MKISGKCSWFGGPQDEGVAPDEDLAFIYDISDAPYLFLPEQPPGTTGLARRLNPEMPYIACRWTYEDEQTRENLLRYVATVYCPRTGKGFFAAPSDWGPHPDTGRCCDLSPGIFGLLGLITDDTVEVTFPVIYERKANAEAVARVLRTIPRGIVGRGEKKRPNL